MPDPTDPFALLRSINSPADLRAQPESELAQVCAQLRQYLIKSVATRGGHFAAGLGTVELTVALHYVFQTPADRLVWDVGHQAYPHKVLTGRRDRLDTIKQGHGLAPFPTRDEALARRDRAIAALEPWGKRFDALREFANFLVARVH